ncbi:type II toxin-antitoxin system RelE/ParE family toxin [Janthinobacterium lividum]|uniref:Type II toxin-antitoxin system RelE/ParE family toxin n=1 Tax=Janthinobacterium lividum TaxID=29581 RepID=A0ABU0Y1P1_9BURK|nr:type II toxin-antitoxin system RelE/ParE family toxin [Janthinobacterium lividum]MDQ4629727.1 type II toxin-antitoxin system RelE/ParE family toxin [Janthinobacterium lividum]MDQ4677860.1 type II toxin-antitoxin system RelE/ParE family toxin [Janthinobacterium lividum]MDQ4688509.1 type II toxin-antitoxin system RelE/ParE family toxin [Janthinobacterium lividum]
MTASTPPEPPLIDTRKTAEYRRWEDSLHDVAAAAIDARIKHLQHGGDWRPVGEGVCELHFLHTGPGWRVYFHETNRGTLILLLLGGNKSSQQRDIKQAQAILRELKARQAALKKAAASPSTGVRKK